MMMSHPTLDRLGSACRVALLAAALCSQPATAETSGFGDPVDVSSENALPAVGALAFEYETAAQPAEEADGYRWRGAPPPRPDWSGAARDTAYFFGYQFAAVALLYFAPESISGWSDEQKENYSLDKWRNNVSRPVWDEDKWWINYLLHPYWGGAYYIRARERGLERPQSFWYSALLSAIYEYGAEALAEPVSIQDLVVTPVAGSLVGEYLFAPLRARIRAKPGELDWSDKAILFATDPLGVLSAETDRLLGVKTTLSWQPVGLQGLPPETGMEGAGARTARLVRGKPAWGLQLRADW